MTRSPFSFTQMMNALRWILLPVACVAAWFAALIIGIFLLEAAKACCPEEQMVSGMCTAPWWRPLEMCIFCFSSGLSAVLVVTAGFFVAPAARVFVAWLACGIGSLVALYMLLEMLSLEAQEWGMFGSAVVAGILAALFLTRYHKSRTPKKSVQSAATLSSQSNS